VCELARLALIGPPSYLLVGRQWRAAHAALRSPAKLAGESNHALVW